MRMLLVVLVGLTFACVTVQKAPGAGSSKIVADPRREDFPVVIASSGIQVDGDLSDWPAGLPVGRVTSADGSHAADFRVFVDATRVYWAVEVVDPTPSLNKQGPGSNWDADAVELFLGTHDDERSGLMPGDVQLIVSYNPAAPLAWNYFSGKAMTGAKVVVKDLSGGWLVEASFSLAELGLAAPAPGAPVWVDMALDDAGGGGRITQLAWLGSADLYKTPLMWKKTTFVAQP